MRFRKLVARIIKSYAARVWFVIGIIIAIINLFDLPKIISQVSLIVGLIAFPVFLTICLLLIKANKLRPESALYKFIFSEKKKEGKEGTGFIGDYVIPSKPPLLVGRNKEITALKREIRNNRCVSIVGQGGAGKTTLVKTLINAIPKHTYKAVYYVPLEDCANTAQIVRKVKSVLRIEEKSMSVDVISNYLRNQRSILVFDNCEQINEEVRVIITDLLGINNDLTFICTSREPLNITEEYVHYVRGLEIPNEQASFRKNEKCAAVVLFKHISKKNCNKSGFSKEEMLAIFEIVGKVEGIPLSILMLASRTDVISIMELKTDILVYLNKPIDQLMPDRHRTVNQCIDWSYKLLDKESKKALGAISKFAPSLSLSLLIAALRQDGGDVDVIKTLAKKSFIRIEKQKSFDRVFIPDLVCSYIAPKRIDAECVITKKIISEIVAFCKRDEHKIYLSDASDAVNAYELEHHNILISLKDLCEKKKYLEIAEISSIYWFWFTRGYWEDVSPLLNNANSLIPDVSIAKAQILLALGTMYWARGSLSEGERHLISALEIFETYSDCEHISQVKHILGHVYHQMNNLPKAIESFDFSAKFWENQKHEHWMTLLANDLSAVYIDEDDLHKAGQYAQKAMQIARKNKDHHGLGNAFMHLGMIDLINSDNRSAKKNLADAEIELIRYGYLRGLSTVKVYLANAFFSMNKKAKGIKKIKEAVEIQSKISYRIGLIRSFEAMAIFFFVGNNLNAAYELIGFIEKIRKETATKILKVHQCRLDDYLTKDSNYQYNTNYLAGQKKEWEAIKTNLFSIMEGKR